jgi:hypothetical protein
MRRNTITRMLFIALLACAPAGLVRCGGTASQIGTETGNPPVIDNQKLRLEWTPNGVRLIGEPGAVTPGAEVRLTNTRTGASASATAAANGSLSLEVPGSLSDPYEVRVSSAGREMTEPLTGGSVTDDLTTLSCQELENRLGQTVAESFANQSTSCQTNAECVHAGWGVGCYYQCGQSVLSLTGDINARALAEQRTQPICAELNRCQREAPSSCPPSPETVLSCLEGSCVERSFEQLSCLELSSEAAVRGGGAVESADKTCTVDADCSLVFPSVRCAPPCRYAVAVANAAAAALPDTIAQRAESVCQAFDQRACPEQLIPCPAPPINPRAVCSSGNRCEVLTGPQ